MIPAHARAKARPPYLRLVTPLPAIAPEPARFLEIAISWGNNPLRVEHVACPATYVLDSARDASFAAPVNAGPIVIDRDGVPHVRVVDRARNVMFMLANGRVSKGVRDGDALLFAMYPGHRAEFELGPLRIEIAAVDLPPPPPQPRWWRLQWALLALSLVLNALVVALLLRG